MMIRCPMFAKLTPVMLLAVKHLFKDRFTIHSRHRGDIWSWRNLLWTGTIAIAVTIVPAVPPVPVVGTVPIARVRVALRVASAFRVARNLSKIAKTRGNCLGVSCIAQGRSADPPGNDLFLMLLNGQIQNILKTKIKIIHMVNFLGVVHSN